MENESGVMNFRIGANFGIMLAELGQEMLFYEMDTEKAIKVYKDSLVGITDEQIYPLLNCNMVLTVDIENQLCDIVERNETHIDYPNPINLLEFITNKTKDFVKAVYEIRPVFKRIMYTTDNRKKIDIEIPISNIIKYIYNDNHNYNELISDYIDFEEEFGELESVIKIYKDTMYHGLKFIQLCKFLDKIYSLGIYSLITDNIVTEQSYDLRAELDCLYNYLTSMQSDLIGYCTDDFHEELKDDELKTYFQSMKENNKILSTEIEPVNIYDKYDAGWLSPEGEFYGLNGHIANMLHITIAEALQRKGVIPDDETNQSLWLDENGWVKIHHDNINFGTYAHSTMKFKKPKFMTNKQIDIVYRYGQTLCSGLLKIGYLLQPMSAVKFQMLAEADSEKLYELF